ncbi:hypothetical protein Agub_g5303, partial [Astrephomene gubernaculifera]
MLRAVRGWVSGLIEQTGAPAAAPGAPGNQQEQANPQSTQPLQPLTAQGQPPYPQTAQGQLPHPQIHGEYFRPQQPGPVSPPRWHNNGVAAAAPASAAGPSYLVSARKPNKRPASELHQDQDTVPFGDLSRHPANNYQHYTPAAAPRAAGLDSSEFRSSKRHAASVGPHTGPWWLKPGGGQGGRRSGGPQLQPPATDFRRSYGSPLDGVRLGGRKPAAAAAAGAIVPAQGPHDSTAGQSGSAAGSSGQGDAELTQWQRAVRITASSIRPALGRAPLPPMGARRPLKRWYEVGDEEEGDDDVIQTIGGPAAQ